MSPIRPFPLLFAAALSVACAPGPDAAFDTAQEPELGFGLGVIPPAGEPTLFACSPGIKVHAVAVACAPSAEAPPLGVVVQWNASESAGGVGITFLGADGASMWVVRDGCCGQQVWDVPCVGDVNVRVQTLAPSGLPLDCMQGGPDWTGTWPECAHADAAAECEPG